MMKTFEGPLKYAKIDPQAVTNIGSDTYTYSDNGELTTRNGDLFTYDSWGRMKTSQVGGTASTQSNSAHGSLATDGYLNKANASWNTAHGAGSAGLKTTQTSLHIGTGINGTGKYLIQRGYLAFDTSSIPDNATILSAQLDITPKAIKNHDNDGDNWITVVEVNPADKNTLAKADYNDFTTTEGIDTADRIGLGSFTKDQTATFTLNTRGQGFIDVTGITAIGLREGHDFLDTPFVGVNKKYSRLTIYPSEYTTNPARQPQLRVTYSEPGQPAKTVTYSYDSSGGRVQKVTPADTTTYTNRYYHEKSDGTTTESTVNIYAGSDHIATLEGGTVTWNHTDHLGSASVSTNSATQITEEIDYLPFGGERLRNSISSSADKTFTDHYNDTETGLLYMQARYYDPEVRRFMAQDPASFNNPLQFAEDPQQLNLYSYVRNNPINYTDPTGLFSKKHEAHLIVDVDVILADAYDRASSNAGKSGYMSFSGFTNSVGAKSIFSFLKPSSENVNTSYIPRYIYTEKAGLVDTRHFYQLMYLGKLGGDNFAVKFGVKHEQDAEAASRFAPEDLTSNALGAYFGSSQLKGYQTPDSFLSSLTDFFQSLGPVQWSEMSESQQNSIMDFYNTDDGVLNPSYTAKPLQSSKEFPFGLNKEGTRINRDNRE